MIELDPRLNQEREVKVNGFRHLYRNVDLSGLRFFIPRNIHRVPFREDLLQATSNPHIIFFGDSMLRPGGKKPHETTEESVTEFIQRKTEGRVTALNFSEPGATTGRIFEIVRERFQTCVDITGDLVIVSKGSINDARDIIKSEGELDAKGLSIVRLYPRLQAVLKNNGGNLEKIAALYIQLEDERTKKWGGEFNTSFLSLSEPPFFKAKYMEFKPAEGSDAKPTIFTIKGHPIRQPLAYLVTAAFINKSFEASQYLRVKGPKLYLSGLSLLPHTDFDKTGHLTEREQERIARRVLRKINTLPPRTGVIYSFPQ